MGGGAECGTGGSRAQHCSVISRVCGPFAELFHWHWPSSDDAEVVNTNSEFQDHLSNVAASYSQRYEQFAARFCELDDGSAAARVVDRVFPW